MSSSRNTPPPAHSVAPEVEAPTLHEQRLEAVAQALCAGGARTVLDLGCGQGDLLLRLAREPALTRVVGLDISMTALAAAEAQLGAAAPHACAAVEVLHGALEAPAPALAGFDAAALVETLEHFPPERLSAVEHAVFARLAPQCVVVTTPNRDWNDRLGVLAGEVRHPGHHFEWSRARFATWARGVAGRNGYAVTFAGIGEVDRRRGCPTQMATFVRAAGP